MPKNKYKYLYIYLKQGIKLFVLYTEIQIY